MRQIRPKVTRHFDDDLAAFEREEELLRTPESEKKKRLFRPLPAAEYQTSQVALQQQVTSPNQHLKALPKVFGVHPTVEAKVSLDRRNVFLGFIYLQNCLLIYLGHSTCWT